jgi:hypothetical protein
MRDMAAKALVLLLSVILSTSGRLPEEHQLLIVIHTTGAGMFGPTKTTWVRVETKNGKYVADNVEISEKQVIAFLAAVDAHGEGPLSTVSFSDLGITQDWLDQNAEPAFDEYFKDRTSFILPAQRDLFISRFRNTSAIGKAVDAYFQSWWTDDFPEAHVEIYNRATNRAIVVESSNLHAFMIPWTISENGRFRISFNANIGRTLGALLPENAALKERISGAYFRRALSRSVYEQVCAEWRKLDRNPKPNFRPPIHSDEPSDYFDPCYLRERH